MMKKFYALVVLLFLPFSWGLAQSVPTNGLTTWLKADSGVVANGQGDVSQWSDQSGNGNHATQSTTANQPILSTSNGTPSLFFSSYVSSFMTVPATLPNDLTAIVVFDTTQTGNGASNTWWYAPSLVNAESASNPYLAWGVSVDGTGAIQTGLNCTPAPTITSTGSYNDGKPHQILFERTQSTGVLNQYVDTVLQGTYTGPTDTITPPTNITIGETPFMQEYFTGNIKEIILYNRTLTSDEKTQINSYLANKYGFYSVGASWISSYSTAMQSVINQFQLTKPQADQFAWITSYSSDVQGEILKHQWNQSQANNYVAAHAANPTLITTGLAMWFKADAGVTQDSNNNVTTWTDQISGYQVGGYSPNGTLSNPSFVSSVSTLNNKPVVRYNSYQFLMNPAQVDPGLNHALTIITVTDTTNPSAYQYSFFMGGLDGGDGRGLGYANTQQSSTCYENSDYYWEQVLGAPAPSAGTYTIDASTLTADLTSATLYLNGTATGSGSLSGIRNPTPGLYLGGASDGPTWWRGGWQGDIAEVLVYDRVLTSSELTQVNAYLSQKYNLGVVATTPVATDSLPGGTYTSAQTVTLTAPAGTAIYYTTDGTTPTTSSSVYTGPLTISSTTTLEYFAVAPGEAPSAVTTVTYTIIPPIPTSGLTTWLKADSGTVTNSQGDVSQWTDQSGSGNNAVQSVTADQPILSNSNGTPSLYFSSYVSSSLTVPTTLPNDLTAIVVFDTTQTGYGASNTWWYAPSLVTAQNQSNAYIAWGVSVDGAGAVQTGLNCTPAPTITSTGSFNDGKPHQILFERTKSTGVLNQYVDTVLQGTYTGPTDAITSPTHLTIGETPNMGEYFTGNIKEVILYNRTLSDTEKAQVNSYLANKYGFYSVGASWISGYSSAMQSVINQFQLTKPQADQFSWITSYSSDVQGEIIKHQWNQTQANNYVAAQASNPTLITAGLSMWFRADAGVTQDSNNHVTTWTDQISGYQVGGYSPTGTTSNPAYVSSVASLNNKPVVRYNGYEFLMNTAQVDPGLNHALTIITVTDTTNPSANEYSVFIGGLDGGDGRGMGYSYNQQTSSCYENFDYYWEQVLGAPAPAANTYTIDATTVSADLTNATLYLNGTQSGSGTLSGIHNPTPGVYLGGASNGPTWWRGGWQGDIAEVLVYDRVLTAPELAQVNAYLSAKYNLTGTPQTTPTATDSLAGGTYSGSQTVTLTAPSGTTIYYTTDGTNPTTSSSVYTGTINISSTTTLEYITVAPGESPSAVTTVTYTIQQLTTTAPTFSLATGTYSSTQNVTITGPTGATIYYTTDGSTPATSSSVYSTPLSISATTTLQAIAVLSGETPSPVTSATYTIDYYLGQTPVLLLISGNNQTAVAENFSSNPLVVQVQDASGSLLVNAPVTFTASGTGLLAATTSGTPTSSLTVTTDSLGLAQVYPYSTDGSASTVTASAGPVTGTQAQVTFTVQQNSTLDSNGLSIAWELQYFGQTGLAASTVAPNGLTYLQCYQYGVSPFSSSLDSNGLSYVWEIQNFNQIGLAASTVALNGLTYLQCYQYNLSVTDSNTMDINGLSYAWEIQYFGQTGIDASALSPAGDGLTIKAEYLQGRNPLDYYQGQTPVLAIISGDQQSLTAGTFSANPLVVQVQDAHGNLLSNAPVTFTASGTGLLAVSPSDFLLNTVTLQTDSLGLAQLYAQMPNPAAAFTITATGGPESGTQAQVTFSVNVQQEPSIPAPTLNHYTGIYSTSQTINLTVPTGATIYYTLDGSSPTTSSSVYTGPITIDSTTTLQAFVIQSGSSSPIVSATYTIDPTTANIPTTGLQTWLRADTGVDANGTTVTQWSDQSGNQLNAVQTSSTNQPIAQTDPVTGIPVLTFDGATSYLTLPGSVTSGYNDFTQGNTVIIISQPTAVTGTLLDLGNGVASDNLTFGLNTNSGLTTQIYNGATASSLNTTSGVTTGSYQILETLQDPSSSTVTQYVNGTALNPTAVLNLPNNLTRADNYLGTSAAGSYFTGNIAEVLIYNRVLTTAERQNVEAYLNQKYNLNITTDTTGDGVPDLWAIEYFGTTNIDTSAQSPAGDGLTIKDEYLQGRNPLDYYQGKTPILTILSGNNQTVTAGTLSTTPLVVQVQDTNGNLLANAPVTFTASGTGLLASSSTGIPAKTITVYTNSLGIAQVYQYSSDGSASTTSASAGPADAPSTTSSDSNQPPPPITPRYAVVDLGPNLAPAGLNNSGQVALNSTNNTVFFFNGTTNVPVPGMVTAGGVSDAGMVAGVGPTFFAINSYNSVPYPNNTALTWNSTNGQVTTLNPYTGGHWIDPDSGVGSLFYITCVNGNGDIAGYQNSAEGGGVKWSSGSTEATEFPPGLDYDHMEMALYGGTPGYGQWKLNINNTGGAVGIAEIMENHATYFTYSGGSIQYINPSSSSPWYGHPNGSANAINDAGLIVGFGDLVGSPNFMAGTAVNNASPAQILSGTTLVDQTDNQGNPTNTYINKPLQQLIAGSTNSPWGMGSATAINDHGLIAGTAYYTPTSTNDTNTAGWHGVLLVPLPELVVETSLGSGEYQPIYGAPLYVPDNGLSQNVVDVPPQDTYTVQMASNLTTNAIGVLNVEFTNFYGTYNGTLTETGLATGIFKSADGTVTATLSPFVQTTDAQVDTLNFIVTAQKIQLSNAPMTVVETTPASYVFNQPVISMSVTLTGNLNPNAPDQIAVNFGESPSMTFVENGNNTKVFTNSASGLTVTLPTLGTLNPNASDNLQVILSGGGESGTYILQETGNNTMTFANFSETVLPGTPDDPYQTHDGVFYVRMQNTGINPPTPLTITVPGGDTVTLQMSPVPGDPSHIISPPILLVDGNVPSYGYNWKSKYLNLASSDRTDFKAFAAGLRGDNGKKKVISPLLVGVVVVGVVGVGIGIYYGSKAIYNCIWPVKQTAFLGGAGLPNLSSHLNNIAGTIKKYKQGPAPIVPHVYIDDLVKALPKYSILYLNAHGNVDPIPSLDDGSGHFEYIWLYQKNKDKTDVLTPFKPDLIPTFTNTDGTIHAYDLVFFNGCGSTDTDGTGPLAYRTALHAKNYVGWSKCVDSGDADTQAETFFKNLKFDKTATPQKTVTVMDAAKGISTQSIIKKEDPDKDAISWMSNLLPQYGSDSGRINLDVYGKDDTVIIDMTTPKSLIPKPSPTPFVTPPPSTPPPDDGSQ